jgi:hypothetical protein
MPAIDWIAKLRALTNQPDQDPYTDQDLLDILTAFTGDDGVTNVNGAAAQVWTEQAARLSGMVNITESGSSRSLSQLYDHALSMAKFYGAGGAIILAPVELVTRTRRIVRPETETQ